MDRVRAHLLVPAEKDAARDLAGAGHRHALVEILHERVVRLRGQRLDEVGDVCRFSGVEDKE